MVSSPVCPPVCPAGPSYLSALPCGSGAGLHVQQQQASGLVRFKIVRATGTPLSSSLLGSRIRIVSYSRALIPTCPAVLALHAQWNTPRPVAAMAGRNPPCGRMAPQLGSLVSLGAQQWVLEDARPLGNTSSDLLVRIRTAVRLVGRLLGFRFQDGCWSAVDAGVMP